jgi:DNA-binding beta-propeller fold protein YncE
LTPRGLCAAAALLAAAAGDFPLGTATDRTDYESIDPAAQRLYIAKMGEGKLLVFDIARNRLVKELDGFSKITGVLAVPQLHRIYASVPGSGIVSSLLVGLGMLGLSSGAGKIAVLDSTNLREIARLPGGVFPDGIAYDPALRRIFVSDEFGSAVRAVDALTNTVLARIDPGGEAGNVQYDPVTARIYVAVQSRDELAAIDPLGLAVTGRIGLEGCHHPHGLAVAAAIGYVACDGNNVLLTVDLAAGKVLGRLPCVDDPDVLAIDPDAGRLYVASEPGMLMVLDLANGRAPAVLGETFVGPGAHALAVDPATHRLYFALAGLRGKSVLRVLAPRP